MNDMDGINTAKEIREIDKKVCIVFLLITINTLYRDMD
ncbi:hypothetical protein H477_4065 [[Clostridium] sordellii ATCC 9714]|nr:hypothetical protein H477_4065 [[Clostridium] sordellii ATCC 9714] [Paeniclostridium sordellii ATCC 9714]